MNTRASFTRMQDSTQADWQIIGGEFMQFSKGLPDRVIAHLKILEGGYGGLRPERRDSALAEFEPMLRRLMAQPRNSIYKSALDNKETA